MSSNIKGLLKVEEKPLKECANPTWVIIQKQFDKNSGQIAQKNFEVRIQKGLNSHKKISYNNFLDKTLYLALETNLPNILKIKSQNIEIDPRGKNYIRLKFMAPDIFCKLTVKMAVIDKEEMLIRDLMVFEIEVFK